MFVIYFKIKRNKKKKKRENSMKQKFNKIINCLYF